MKRKRNLTLRDIQMRQLKERDPFVMLMSHPARSLAIESFAPRTSEPIATKQRRSVFAAFAILLSKLKPAKANLKPAKANY
jgi:hypothetical protein